MALTCENYGLNKTIDDFSKKNLKGKGKGSRIQFQLEEDLTNAKADLSILMNQNPILKDEITQVKTNLKKACKWTSSCQVVTNPNSHEDGSIHLVKLTRSMDTVPCTPYEKDSYLNK
ncbi:hypothetical protein FXO37_33810 [Capsicum annuum]|nr:hypothetical protein FXO37_33810 [Capsicum annuum]